MTIDTTNTTSDATTDAAPAPVTGKRPRKVREPRAPRAGSITGYLLRGIPTAGQSLGTTTRELVNHLRAQYGIEYPLRAVAATMAILRARGVVASAPIVGDEVGRHAYTLTARGAAMRALMGEDEPRMDATIPAPVSAPEATPHAG